MLDGAEAILREKGYGALTSRAVAEQVGVKQRLVYYYFRTMDDLIIETFRRLAQRDLGLLREAQRGARPLGEIWDLCMNSADATLISEFMALANHIDGLRREVIEFIEESRNIQIAALSEALEREADISALPAPALAILATSLALSLKREAALGVTMGHVEIMEVIGSFLARAEPDSQARPAEKAARTARRAH